MPSSSKYIGQNGIANTTLSRIDLPKMIPCSVCKKNRPQAQFSGKQQNDLKSKIARFGRTTITPENSIRCMQCTGQQTTQLYCILCQDWKNLDKFAKNQRSQPDTCKCTECMIAQEMTLPSNSYPVQLPDESEDAKDRREDRQGDPWIRDSHTGFYHLDKENCKIPRGVGSEVTGSSRDVSGYESSSNSISGYSKVAHRQHGSKRDAHSILSDKASTTTERSGVKVNSPGSKNTGRLTLNNLANIDGPPSIMEKLSLQDPYADFGGDEDSNDDADTVFAPSVKGSSGPASQADVRSLTGDYDEDDEESDDDSRRPKRLPVTRATPKYTAYDPHGVSHEINDAASAASSAAPSSSAWSTVSKSTKISHSGFDHRTLDKNADKERKFPRVRPQNLDTSRLGEGLLFRDTPQGRGGRYKNRVSHWADDEDY